MPKKHYLTIAAAALLGLSCLSTALAGTETAAPGKETKQVTPPCPVTYITGDFGVTFTSEYVSRGLVLQDKGLIAQPYLDLYVKLYSGDATSWFINSVSAQLSFWSDISNNKDQANTAIGLPPGYVRHNKVFPGTNTRTDAAPDWYEFDWDPGISVTFAQKFTLLVQYMEFDSPSGAFDAERSVNATLSYDDSSLLGAFALHPHGTVLYELGAPGAAGISGKGWYYELGVAPSYTFMPKSTYPVTIATPFTVGLGDSRFYEFVDFTGKGHDNNFGYFSVGPSISVPLAFIPSGYGSWTVTASYLYYYEGTTVRMFNNSNGTDASNSRNVISGAIGCTF
jgi:hypothetical protein